MLSFGGVVRGQRRGGAVSVVEWPCGVLAKVLMWWCVV